MTSLPMLYQARPPSVQDIFRRADPALRAAAVICAAAIVPTLLALMFDTRVLDDEALWLKPLKFQISMALLAATVALVPLAFDRGGNSAWVRWPARLTAAVILYEVGFLSLQAARGVRSHFNDTTPFDAIGGAIMAAGAGVLVTGPAVIGGYLAIRAWRAGGMTPLHLGIGLGLVVGGVLAAWSGSALGANGGPFVGAYDPADPVLPLFGWSRAIGDLRVGHFIGLHLMQVLPVAGMLVAGWPRQAGMIAVAAVGILWAGLAVVAQKQALAGLPVIPF